MSTIENRPPNPDHSLKNPEKNISSGTPEKKPAIDAKSSAEQRINQAKLESLKARTDMLNGNRKNRSFDSTMREDLRAAAKEELKQLPDPQSQRFNEVLGILKSLDDEGKSQTDRAQNSMKSRADSQRDYTSFLLQKFDTRMGKVGTSADTYDRFGTFLTAALAQMEESDKSGAKMKAAMKDPMQYDLVSNFGYVHANDLKNERNFLTSRINLWGAHPNAKLFENRIAELNAQLRSDSGHADQAAYDAERWNDVKQGDAIKKQYFDELRAKNPPGETMSETTLANLRKQPLPSAKNQAEERLQQMHNNTHGARMKDLPKLSSTPRGKNIRDRINNAVADSKNVLTSLDENRMGEIAALQKELSGVMAYKQAIEELQKSGQKPEVSTWMLDRYNTIRSSLVSLAKDYPSALDDVKPDASQITEMKTLAMQNVKKETLTAEQPSKTETVAPRTAPQQDRSERVASVINKSPVEAQRNSAVNRGGGFGSFFEALGRFFASFRVAPSEKKAAKTKKPQKGILS